MLAERQAADRRADVGAGRGLVPAEDLERAVGALDDRRAAFHPVARVDVVDAADALDRGVVDVAADDAVDLAARASAASDLLERGR